MKCHLLPVPPQIPFIIWLRFRPYSVMVLLRKFFSGFGTSLHESSRFLWHISFRHTIVLYRCYFLVQLKHKSLEAVISSKGQLPDVME
jgi:hypothetical protein